MSNFYDSLETRDPAAREAALMAALPGQIALAQAKTRYYAKTLAAIQARTIESRAALARLPITRKSELLALQHADPPFGGLNATPLARVARVFQSPGPIFEPEGRRADPWRFARALYAAGFRAGDLVHNAFSYHFTPAGAMFETAAAALGCPVFPAGTGQTEQQVAAIAQLKPQGYAGTPSFLKIIIEKAVEQGASYASMTKAIVGGEALPPSLRAWLEEHGVRTTQTYGTADLGSIAYETEAREGLILDEELIVEIVRPGTGDPVADGEVGEIVVTTLNPDYPLVRFATGDMSAILPGTSPCGRTGVRIRGWMGRADQTTKVRGMFVHPSQIAEIAKRHPEIIRARLVVGGTMGQDTMILRCETAAAGDALAGAIGATIRDVTKLRGEVELVGRGSLPNDGKVIEDARKYD